MKLAPARIDDITAHWLTKVLQEKFPSVEVESLQAEPATIGTTTRIRVQAKYNDAGWQAGLPEALFIKCHAENPNHEYLIDKQIYAGEVGFYKSVAGHLSIPTPKCVAAELDSGSGGFLLIIEDLVAAGATWGSALTPLTEGQARRIVQVMASYHSAFWGGAAATDWMARVASGALAKSFYQRYSNEATAAELIETSRGEALTGDLRNAATLSAAFLELQRRNAQEPLCMLHGDPHVANIAFMPDDEPVFTDWQIVRRGRYAYDLCYCLVGGLAADDRRAWLPDLVALYVVELSERGVQGVGRKQAQAAVAENVIHGLVMFLGNRDTMLPEEINSTYVQRYAVAATELESLRLLSTS